MITSIVSSEGPSLGMFSELKADVRSRLSAAGRFESAREGTYLVVQGREHRTLALVVSGLLRVSCTVRGDTMTLAELGPGEVVGEMSVIDPRPASASVKVIGGPAALWLIDGDDFDRFVRDDVAAGYAVMRLLAKKLCHRLRHDAEHFLHREESRRSRFLEMDY